MNKIFKGLIRFLIEVIVMTVLIVGINIFTNGMYLWGLPRINDIQSVNITYPSVTDDVKEISSSEDIELALKLTGFLKYDLFGEVNSEEEPAITITYFLKDPKRAAYHQPLCEGNCGTQESSASPSSRTRQG